MSNINLLPWRQQRKATQKRRVLLHLALCCALTMAVMVAVNTAITRQYQHQQQRNSQWLHESAELDGAQHSLALTAQQHSQLQARIELVAQFQHRRQLAVQLFNQLPSWVPAGVSVEGMNFLAHGLEITGTTETYNSLSRLVQHMEHSGWFMQPRLDAVATADVAWPAVSQFSLQLPLKVVSSPPSRFDDQEVYRELAAE